MKTRFVDTYKTGNHMRNQEHDGLRRSSYYEPRTCMLWLLIMELCDPGDKLWVSLTCLQRDPSVSQTLPRAVRHCGEQVPQDSVSTDHRHCLPVSTVRICFLETWNACTNENTAIFNKIGQPGRGGGEGEKTTTTKDNQETNKIGK